MKAFWWKLTVDWPCALGDWLWAYLVVPLLVQLERLTFKRVIYLAALTLAIYAFAQVATIDVAFVMAGDTVFYLEIASAVMFFVVRGHVRQSLHMIGEKTRTAVRRATALMRRYGDTVRQRRNANALRRKRGDSPESSDDGATAWIGGLYASA